ILCMTDFGNPILIGGRYNVLATEIYAQVIGMSNFAAGTTMSIVLIVACLVAYLVNAYWVGTKPYVTVSAGARTAVRPTPPALRRPLFVLAGGAALFGAVIGVGYIIAFNVPPLLLTGTVWILVTSVVFWKFPVAVLAGINALKQIDPAIEEAAVSLGAGSVRTFARVVMPLLTGSAFSIFVYFFVNGMVTVSAVIFLIYPGFNLGSVAILNQVENGYPGGACALGTLILAIVIGSVLLLRALVGGDRVAVLKL